MRFFKYFILISICCIDTGFAENALQAMGIAMQDHYFAVKKLGPNPSPPQLENAKRRSYERANALWDKEMNNLINNYEKTGSQILTEMVAQGKLPLLTSETTSGKSPAYSNSGSEESLAEDSTPVSSSPSAKNSRSPSSNTGEFGGSEGAQIVTFGEKGKKEDLQVKDGIIQNK